MPELQTLNVKASTVKPGDFIVEDAGTVYSRVSKIKWTTIELSSGGVCWTVKYENDAYIDVDRSVTTEEEKAAADLRRRLIGLDGKEAQARASLVHAREKTIKSLESGWHADSSTWMDVPVAEALVDLWDNVVRVHKMHAQRDDIESMTRVEAVRFVCDYQRKQALSYYRALSRSTSVVSNLFEDIKLEVLSSWVRELEWIILEEG